MSKEMKTAIIITILTLGVGFGIYKLKKYNDSKKGSIWKFKDNLYLDNGNLGFVGEDKPFFEIGSKITIKQDDGAKYAEYDGDAIIQNIFQKEGWWCVETDKKRLGDTPENSGKIILLESAINI